MAASIISPADTPAPPLRRRSRLICTPSSPRSSAGSPWWCLTAARMRYITDPGSVLDVGGLIALIALQSWARLMQRAFAHGQHHHPPARRNVETAAASARGGARPLYGG